MNQALASPAPITPPHHQVGYTPPTGHLPAETVLLDRRDIDAAVQQKDVDFLVLALQCTRLSRSSDPVHQAVSCQHPGALELLLRSGYSAEGQGRGQLLRTLVKAGFTSKDSNEYKMAKLLLQYGSKPDDSEADSDMDGDSCMSLLGLASSRQCVLGAELLLLYGADANRVRKHGKNSLHAVCEAVCPFQQPLNMLPMFPEVNEAGSFAELLGVDALSLPSFQGAFDDVFDSMPPEMPPLPSLANLAARAQPSLASAAAADPLRSANVFHSLRNQGGQDWSHIEMQTQNQHTLPGDPSFSKARQILELLLRRGANACAQDDSGQTPADRLPRLAIHLRAKLQRAEGWLRRQNFILACSPLQTSAHQTKVVQSDGECSESAVTVCLGGSSDIIEAIAIFL